MGTCGYNYISDITRTFPVSGKFTEKQKEIYNLVYTSNMAVIEALRPGIAWTDMHILADRIHIEGLVRLGLLIGDVEEMVAKRVGAIFMPCGLGHLIGLNTHDVGGYTEGPVRSK
jgi:Xaa-Pro dipeptidase